MMAAVDGVRSQCITARQAAYRAQRERVRALCSSDREAEIATALVGTLNAPEDFGPDGRAALSRQTVREDADGRSGASSARHGVRTQRTRIVCECVLDSLFVRENGAMTEAQYRVGMRFRRFWIASAHASRVSGDYGQRVGRSASSMESAEYYTDARHAVDQALEMLNDPQRRAVKSICGQDERVGLRMKTLLLALDVLDKNWMRSRKKA